MLTMNSFVYLYIQQAISGKEEMDGSFARDVTRTLTTMPYSVTRLARAEVLTREHAYTSGQPHPQIHLGDVREKELV